MTRQPPPGAAPDPAPRHRAGSRRPRAPKAGRGRLAAVWRVLPFLALFVYLLVHYQYVYRYFDDYGYASLSYGYILPDVAGTDFTIGQVLEYQWAHYRWVHGRNFLVHIALLQHLWLARLVMAAAIPLAYYLLLRIMRARSFLAAAALALSYALFPFGAYRTGFYWFAAALSYALPLVLLFGAIGLVMLLERGRLRHPRLVLAAAAIALFATATFHEQLGLTVYAFTGILGLIRWIKSRKLPPRELVLFLASLAGAALVILAPGTIARQQTAITIPYRELVASNAARLFSFAFDPGFRGYAFTVALAIITGLVALANYRAKRWSAPMMIGWLAGAAGLVAVVALASGAVFYAYPPIFAVAALSAIVQWLIREGRLHAALLLVAAVATLIGLVFVSAYMVERMVILAELMIFAAGALAVDLSDVKRWLKAGGIVLLAVYAGLVLTASTRGYMGNQATLEQWDRDLGAAREATERAGPDAPPGSLTLEAYPDRRYASDMHDVVVYYLRAYYNLPDDFHIGFVAPTP